MAGVIIISFLFQALAFILSVSVILTSRQKVAWSLISIATFFGAVTKWMAVQDYLAKPYGFELPTELTRLGSSLFIFLGVVFLFQWFGKKQQVEQRLETLSQVSPDVLVQFNADGRFEYANPATAIILGIPPEKLKGKKLAELCEKDDQSTITRTFHQLSAKPGKLFFRTRFLHPDGNIRWLEWNAISTAESLHAIYAIGRDVTERWIGESLLRLLESAVAHASDCVLITDNEQKVNYVNPAFATYTGHEQEALRGKSLALALSLQTSDQVNSTVEATLRTTESTELEVQIPNKSGEIHWFSMAIDPILNPANEITHYVVVLQDISERKIAEALLKERERRFREIVNTSPIAIIEHDMQGRIMDMNPAGESIFAVPKENLINTEPTGLIHEEDQFSTMANICAAAKTPTSNFNWLNRVIDVDGNTHFMKWTSGPRYDSSNQIVGSITFGLDLTTEIKAEEALRHSESRYRMLLETMPSLIYCFDPECRFMFVNQIAARGMGHVPEEMTGKSLRDLNLPIDALNIWEKYLEKCLNQKQPQEFSFEMDKRYYEVVLAPDLDEQGRPMSLIAIARDFTDKKQLEAQLRQSQKMETVGTLAGGVAHDFNNQLTAIIGNIGIVLAQIKHGEKFHRELLDAEVAAQRCADMTRSLLAFSRRITSVWNPINLNNVVNETCRLLKRVLPSTIKMESDIESKLWVVNADATQMQQVLMNLAVNARDAMPHGGTVTISTRNVVLDHSYCEKNLEARPGKFTCVSVEDTGTGITPEVMSRLFEPFFTTKEIGKGTGLGLSMVYGIVKAHNGWVNVYSEVGKGTIFRFYLSTTEATENVMENRQPVVRGGKETLLLVDDEEIILRVTRRILESKGYTIFTAADGQEAVDIYRDKGADIHLTVMDMTMPKLTGKAAVELIHKMNPDARVLISSGYNLNSESIDFKKHRYLSFIQKPYVPEELAQKVREMLDME